MKITVFFFYVFIITLLNLTCQAQSDIQVPNGTSVGQITFPGTQCSYNWTNDNPAIGLAASGTGSISSFTAKNTTNSPIVANITATPAISGMAYIANNYSDNVSIIDLSTNTVIKTINVGRWPVTAAVNAINNQVYIANSGSGSVSVINTTDNTIKTTISVGSYPFGLCVSRDGSRAFVANYNDNDISVINTTTNTVIDKFSAYKAYFMSTSTDDKYLYVANYDFDNYAAGTVTVLDAKTGAKISVIIVGSQPWDVNTTPDGKFAYVANENGSSISVINTMTNAVTATIPTAVAPRHVVFSPDGSLFYLRAGYNNTLTVYRTSDFSIKATIPLIDPGSCGISISPDGKRLLVINQITSTVTVIDATTNTVVANIQTPGDGSVGWGNAIIGGNNCEPTTFKITVDPSPNVAATGSLSLLSTTYGSNSETTSLTIDGTWLTSAITVSAPAGFEISTDNSKFNNTLIINQNSGKAHATLYVRLSSKTAVNKYSGDIILSTKDVSDIKVPMPESEVKPALLTITADDKIKFFGTANPLFTASFTGFVNNENSTILIKTPSIYTTAITTSAIGKYPIIAGGATAVNYSFKYVDGTLTIVENTGVLNVPNMFTPNDDGVNDTWVIKNIATYPENSVTVFNRYGKQVFFSKGYGFPWDGKYLSKDVPDGVYFYIIKTGQQTKPLSGTLTIVR